MKFLYLLPLLLFLAACSDDKPSDNGVIPGDDNFVGTTHQLLLRNETSGFNSSSFTLVLQAPDGSIISRPGTHHRLGQESNLNLTTGLADGTYRMLYLEYPISDHPDLADLEDSFSTTQFGLGSRIEVKGGKVTVLDYYDEEIGLPGRGTKEEPYEISSYNSLLKLAQIVNSDEKNGLITEDTHFRQTGKIDLYQASREADRRYGWIPIGANSALPFRGHYHGAPLSTMIIDRPTSAAVGLFGYVHNAAIYDITLSNSAVTGNFATGGIVGAGLMSGKDRGLVSLTGCRVSGCEITGSDQSVGAGALIGMVDMQSRAFLQSCDSEGNTVSCSYNAGGLVGGSGLYSAVSFASCGNTSEVKSEFSGAGGLIGTCDTIQAGASWNAGLISGATRYNPSDTKNSGIGAGGLVGGFGAATITSCHNTGHISGYAGVGGLVGSGRVKGSDTEAYLYNNVMLRYCYNDADIEGTECVGGLVGEAQAGTYAVYNKGNVKGNRYVAGIAGCTSIAVAHNAINLGTIDGADYVAGIVGKTQFGSIALNHNYGPLKGSGTHLGGIVALAGNNTIINSCGNFGSLTSTSKGPVGGIVAEVGDPRVWTAMNIAECIIGSLEIAMGLLAPQMAVYGKKIAAFNHTLELFLHVSETATDTGLLVYDAITWSIGVNDMIEASKMAEISTQLTQEVGEINNEIKRTMSSLRSRNVYSLHGFDNSSFSSGYAGAVDSNLGFYEAEGGDMAFNERLNLLREEREETLEKAHERDEIIHQCVGGICLVVGTVATIGGIVATGGAAVPFVLAGAAASVAGGLNTLTKTCLEFEENVVIISQCVNGGNIDAPKGGDIAGLVGRLQDNSILRDCLNTGNGPGYGYPFIAHSGDETHLQRLVALSDYNSWEGGYSIPAPNVKAIIMWNPAVAADNTKHGDVLALRTPEEVSDPESYKKVDSSWNIGGEDSLWKIGATTENAFPVPAWSEMTK